MFFWYIYIYIYICKFEWYRLLLKIIDVIWFCLFGSMDFLIEVCIKNNIVLYFVINFKVEWYIMLIIFYD